MTIFLDRACDVTAWASEDETRGPITHVYLDTARGVVVATDSHTLIEVPLLRDVRGPITAQISGEHPASPVLIPRDALTEAFKRVLRKVNVQGADRIAVTVDGGAVALTTWGKDGGGQVETRVKPKFDRFPDVEQVMPIEPPIASIIVDASLLSRLATFADKHAASNGGHPRLTLHVRGMRDPLVAELQTSDGRAVRACVMPIFGGPKDAAIEGWAQKASLLELRKKEEAARAEIGRLSTTIAILEEEIAKLHAAPPVVEAPSTASATDGGDCTRCKSIEEQHERIVENLRQERDAASEKLDEILMHAPHHKTIPGADDAERVKNALERYSDLVTFLEDHADLTSAELLGSFDLKIKTVGEWLDDYDKAIEVLAEACDGSTTKLERGDLGGALKTYCDEHDGDAVKKADAIRVVEAATELIRDLEWQRPNPYPLADLRDALRTYHGKDDVRAPSLPGVE